MKSNLTIYDYQQWYNTFLVINKECTIGVIYVSNAVFAFNM